jgi:Tfp pilus assembly protein PilP
MRPAVLLSTLLLVAGCGGGQDEKAEYVERASTVCSDARAEFEALTVPSTAEGFGPYAEQLVAVVDDAQSQLAALPPPEQDRDELEQRFLEPLGGLVEEGTAFAEQVRAAGTDQAALLALLAQRPTADEVDTDYLRSYGLDACAEAIEQLG